jgi:hypothetical protein
MSNSSLLLVAKQPEQVSRALHVMVHYGDAQGDAYYMSFGPPYRFTLYLNRAPYKQTSVMGFLTTARPSSNRSHYPHKLYSEPDNPLSVKLLHVRTFTCTFVFGKYRDSDCM